MTYDLVVNRRYILRKLRDIMSERKVKQTVYGKVKGEGHGAKVRRTIGSGAVRNLDPFLMLDQMVECELPNGFPDHAHRWVSYKE